MPFGFSIKILCWNIQGGKKPKVLRELLYLKKKYNPDIVFIIETLTNSNNNQRIMKALHFQNKLIIDPINHVGGMWVSWDNSNLTVQNHHSHERLVYLDIFYKPQGKVYSILDTYCPLKRPKTMLSGHF